MSVCCCHRLSDERGFSLVELAVVMVISAMVMVAATSSWGQFKSQERMRVTNENSTTATEAMVVFFSLNGRYPCPADPTLPQTDPNYGREKCPTDPAVPLPGTCSAGVCRGTGGDGNLDLVPDNVLIGAIPFAGLFDPATGSAGRISQRMTLDGWDRKMTYVVTETMTVAASFKESEASVLLRKRDGVSPTILTAATATLPGGLEKNIHFAVISHGPDGIGAYSVDGVLGAPCAGVGIDLENCDLDGLLISELTRDIRSLGAGPQHYDDIVVFKHWGMNDLWGYSSLGTSIINKNPLNVGIGTDNPVFRLDVAGDVKALEVHSDNICDGAGNCFSPETFSNPGVECPPGQAVTQVGNNNIACAAPVFNPIAGTCVGGQYVIGFRTSGGVICGP